MHNAPFILITNQWYYFETTFTRGVDVGTEAIVTYDMLIAEASSNGIIGNVLDRYSHTMASISYVSELNSKIYGAFRGVTAYSNLANGVMDNFYVSKAGISKLPPLQVVSYSHNGTTGESTVVFNSETGSSFSLWGCDDLMGWTEPKLPSPAPAAI